MNFYVIAINGLDLIIVGPFAMEDAAMGFASRIQHISGSVVRTQKTIELSGAYMSPERFCAEYKEFMLP